jgi:hypothetical protein
VILNLAQRGQRLLIGGVVRERIKGTGAEAMRHFGLTVIGSGPVDNIYEKSYRHAWACE